MVWTSEFGRTPWSQNTTGRDHNPKGYTSWMAGGGIKGGVIHGGTDEVGYQAVDSKFLTGAFALLTGTLPVRNMHFDQCSCGSLPVLPVQHPKGGCPAPAGRSGDVESSSFFWTH